MLPPTASPCSLAAWTNETSERGTSKAHSSSVYTTTRGGRSAGDKFAAGVLLGQVAVEMGALNAFTSLLVRRDGPVDDAILRSTLPDVSFMEEGTRRLWTELTGHSVTKPKQPPMWANYARHVEYHNEIAHGTAWGDSIGRQSVEAAGALILRLDDDMREVDATAGDS